jgi:thiol-disulfide isomerase/thioredoxin
MFMLVSREKNIRLLDSLYNYTIINSPTANLKHEDVNVFAPFYKYYQKQLIRLKILKKAKFIYPENNEDFLAQIYEFINCNYKGIERQEILTDFLCSNAVNSNKRLMETWIPEFLSEKDFPEYKRYVSTIYNSVRALLKGSSAPFFGLPDSSNRIVRINNFLGKVIVLDFWFTGCTGCLKQAPYLKKIENVYKDNRNVVFIDISIDNDLNVWKRSLRRELYSSTNSLSLNAAQESKFYKTIADYNVLAYPHLVVIDKQGKIYAIPGPIQSDRQTDGLINILNECINQ